MNQISTGRIPPLNAQNYHKKPIQSSFPKITKYVNQHIQETKKSGKIASYQDYVDQTRTVTHRSPI